MYSLDADFVINSDWHLNGWVSYDETKASQFNGRWDRRSEDHEIDRSSDLKDTGLSIGLGLVGQATSRLKVGADLQWTRTVSKYDDQVIAVGESQSAFALTTYADGVQPLTEAFDGFLIHSRGGAALPLAGHNAGDDVDIASAIAVGAPNVFDLIGRT